MVPPVRAPSGCGWTLPAQQPGMRTGRQWAGKVKTRTEEGGGGVRRAEKVEGRWTLRVTRRLWGLEGMLHRWMTLGKLIYQSLSFPIWAMVLILTSYELNVWKHVKDSSEGLEHKHTQSMTATCTPAPHRGPRRPWPHSGHQHMQAWFVPDQGLQTSLYWRWPRGVFGFPIQCFIEEII